MAKGVRSFFVQNSVQNSPNSFPNSPNPLWPYRGLSMVWHRDWQAAVFAMKRRNPLSIMHALLPPDG